MYNPDRVLIIIWMVIGLFSLSGCGSVPLVHAFSVQTAQGSPITVKSQDIAIIYEYGKPAGKSYAVLGKVMAYKKDGSGTIRELDYRGIPPADMVEGLKEPARLMRANAIIGIYYGEYRDADVDVEYVSGLAVQVQKEVKARLSMQDDIQVGILPVQIGKTKMDKNSYAILDRDMRAGARWFLEDKGYYAPVDPAVQFTGTVQDLIAYSQSNSRSLYGDETELLMLIELIDEQATTPVLSEFRTVVLKASLFSKSLGKVIWENQVQNEKVSSNFWTWLAEAETRAGMIKEILKPLQFFSRMGMTEFVAYPSEIVKKEMKLAE